MLLRGPRLFESPKIMATIMIGVYRIFNSINGASYIGSSCNVLGRMKGHLRELRNGRHGNSHLQRAWIKYGESAFAFEPLIQCPISKLMAMEQRFIDKYYQSGVTLYNQQPSSHSRVGFAVSVEVRRKMSRARKGVKLSAQHIKSMSLARIGKRKSIEVRMKMSLAHRGRKHSDSHRANHRAALIGRKHTLSARIKMSIAHKSKHVAPEVRRKIRKALIGRTITPEWRTKISRALRTRHEMKRLATARPHMNKLFDNWIAERYD